MNKFRKSLLAGVMCITHRAGSAGSSRNRQNFVTASGQMPDERFSETMSTHNANGWASHSVNDDTELIIPTTVRNNMKVSVLTAIASLNLVQDVSGFQLSAGRSTRTALKVINGDQEPILEKAQRVFSQNAPPFDPQFDSMVRSIFPDAISNSDFEYRVVAALAQRGFSKANTLLATSLCSDEVAKRLADDFASIFGSNYNLGGLAGFPFAGNIGFQTMSGHIPDGGSCLLVYGPHVGITRDGTVGKVEREGVAVDAICCMSSITACNQVTGASSGMSEMSEMDMFTDLQQGAVQNLVTPLAERLQASGYPMLELPYSIFESQNQLMEDVVSEGIGRVKEGGIVLLGGVQINTGPTTLDYFHPLRFDLISSRGELVENLLPTIL
jgi:hypothetical protein